MKANQCFKISCLFFLLFSNLFSQTNDEKIKKEIYQIENNLLPGLKVKGEISEKFNLFKRMKYYNVPGMSVAVVKDGRIHWAKAYGIADTKSGRKVDEETLFQAASISKPVTALAVLKLAQERRINLDDEVNKYLKDWKIKENKFTQIEKVTIRRLLTHTGGLNAHGFGGYKQNESFPSTTEVLNGKGNSIKVEVIKEPGSIWSYSGGGYVILQKLIEDVTGLAFEDYMKKEILIPFGMYNSTYEQPIDPNKYPNISAAYLSNGKMIQGKWHNYPEKGAGGLWTTATDLAKYCIGIQKAFLGLDTNILSKQTINRMLTQHKKDWGLGPLVKKLNKDIVFTHDGSNAGFKADFVALANKGEAIVVMCNGDKGADLAGEVIRSISSFYGWNIRKQREIDPKNMSEKELDTYVGSYSWMKRSTYVVEVKRKGDQLYFIAPDDDGNIELTLTPYTHLDFIDLKKNVEINFQRSDQGKVTGLTWRGFLDFKKIN